MLDDFIKTKNSKENFSPFGGSPEGRQFIPLSEAGHILNTSRDYMNVLVRRRKLRAVKLGRNWVTTNEWLSEYQKAAGRVSSAVSFFTEREKHLQTEALIPEIKLPSRELKSEEKSEILQAALERFKSADVSEFQKVSKRLGILKSLKSWPHFKFSLASGLVIILLAVSLGLAFFEIPTPGIKNFSIPGISTAKFQASIVSGVFKNFPSDISLFYKWLADSVSRSLAFLKLKTPSELVIGELVGGEPRIVKPRETPPRVDTFEEALALDSFGPGEEAPQFAEGEGIPAGSTALATSGQFTILENRLSVVETDLKDQTDLINSELSLQKKTILGALETLFGLAKLVPEHPLSTLVVQGQPATLTTYAIAPQVQTGFDRLSASYLTLSNNATINGSLTVKSGGTFDTLSVSGNSTLTGDASIGGIATITGKTTIGGNLTVNGTATSTIAGPLIVSGSFTANNSTLVISSTSTVSSQFTVTGVPIGAHSFSSWAVDTANSNVSNSSLFINPASAGADTNLFGLAINGNVKALIDAEGDLFINSITTSGGVTLSTTTASTFTVENNTTLGDSTGDTLTVNARMASNLIPATDNLYRIGTSSLRWLSLDANFIVASSTLAVSTTTFPFGYGVNIATSTNIYGNLTVSGNGVFNNATTTGLTVQGGTLLGSLSASNTTFTTATTSALSVTGGALINSLGLTNALAVASGGTGATTLSGLLQGNGTSAITGVTGTAGQIPYYNGTNTLLATSTIFLSTAGNVGIGTAGPKAPLFVLRSGTSQAVETSGYTAVFQDDVAASTNASVSIIAGPNALASLYLTEGTSRTGGIEYNTTNDRMSFRTIGISDRVVINSSGNVGIGTTTPNNLLSISSATTPALGFTTAAGFGWTVGMDTADSNKFKIASSTAVGTNTRLTIDGNGNVGVGTTSPITTFAVNGSGYFGNALGVGILNTTANTFRVGQCVTGDSRLRRRRRKSKCKNQNVKSLFKIKKLGEDREYLYEEIAIVDIQAGDEILSLNEKTGLLEWQPVLALCDMGEQPVYKIKTASGKTIRTTSNHPYLTRYGWIPVGDLRGGDEIAVPSVAVGPAFNFGRVHDNSVFFNIKRNPEISNAEAMSGGREINKGFSPMERIFLNSIPFQFIFKALLNLRRKLFKFPFSFGRKFNFPNHKKFGDYKLNSALILSNGINPFRFASSMPLSNSLAYLGFTGRRLSSSSMSQPAGLTVLEWYSSLGRRSTNCSSIFESTSSNAKVSKINNWGTPLRSTTIPAREPFSNGNTDLGTARSQETSLASDNADNFVDNNFFLAIWDKYIKKIKKLSNDTGDAAWDEIISIEYAGIKQVYDISVANTHNFIANGIIAHNTAFIVDGSGNVGVGTTSPGSLLSVHSSGNVYFGGALTVSGNSLFGNATTTGLSVNGGTLLGSLAFGNATGTALTINGGVSFGSLGVTGNTNLGNATTTGLTVTGGASFNSITLSATSTMNGFNLCTSANGICASNLTGTTGQIAYFSGTNTAVGTSTIFISTAGNVGIGTTSPSSLLSVAGNIYSTGKIGIGRVPTNNLDIVNSGGGTARDIRFYNSSGTAKGYVTLEWGTGQTVNGAVAGDLIIESTSGQKIFLANNTEASLSVGSGIVSIGAVGPTLQLPNTDQQILIGGTTDPGWGAPAIQLGAQGAFSISGVGGDRTVYIGRNFYDTGGGILKYLSASTANFISFDTSGRIILQTAASGSQDGSLTPTNAIQVADPGLVAIGRSAQTNAGMITIIGAQSSTSYDITSGTVGASIMGLRVTPSLRMTSNHDDHWGIDVLPYSLADGSARTVTNQFGVIIRNVTKDANTTITNATSLYLNDPIGGGTQNRTIWAASGAHLTTAGVWTNASSRSYKDLLSRNSSLGENAIGAGAFQQERTIRVGELRKLSTVEYRIKADHLIKPVNTPEKLAEYNKKNDKNYQTLEEANADGITTDARWNEEKQEYEAYRFGRWEVVGSDEKPTTFGFFAEELPDVIRAKDGKGVPTGPAIAWLAELNKSLLDRLDRTQSADVAEWTRVVGDVSSYEPGDLMMISGEDRKAAKADSAKKELMIGVVTLRPSIAGISYDITTDLTSGITDKTYVQMEKDYNAKMIATIGYTPIKVSTENGPLLPGDPITASSIPGVGRKAMAGDKIVGYAFESFDPANGKMGTNDIELPTPIDDKFFHPMTKQLVNGLWQGWVFGYVNLGQSQLAAKQGTIDLATLNSDLNLNSFSILNVKSISGMNGLWKIDENGNITAQSVETQKLTVGGGVASGVTIYDRGTSAPKCIYIEGGVIKTSDGACGTMTNAGTEAVVQQAADTPTTIPGIIPVATSSIPGISESAPVVATTTEPILTSTTTPEIISTATATSVTATSTP